MSNTNIRVVAISALLFVGMLISCDSGADNHISQIAALQDKLSRQDADIKQLVAADAELKAANKVLMDANQHLVDADAKLKAAANVLMHETDRLMKVCAR